ncbi:MAG: putative 4-hydroxybenzoate polyprenyltransferase [Oligoflexia bacterium]|nr:putative 4-hydroxybenzoate polyprenyltransferase [Oligoflexia bacterium]
MNVVNVREQMQLWGRVVKFSHSIFALPFALSMAVYVSVHYRVVAAQWILIVCAVVSARTAAMCFNRIVDRHIDALNPRTRSREIPSGEVSVRSVAALLIISSAVFILSSAGLGQHCLIASPLVLATLLFYSWTKRFTAGSHFVLGLALAMAPGGVWYALVGTIEMLPIPLMLGVLLWVGGFDILYSCQDVDFDRAHKLHSLPSCCGVVTALWIARLLHVLALLCFGWFGVVAGLGVVYFAMLAGFSVVLASQHFLISPDDFSRIDQAFFTRNGIASVVFFLGLLVDQL